MSTTTSLNVTNDTYVNTGTGAGTAYDSATRLIMHANGRSADNRVTTALMQYTLPTNLKYKKILSAKLTINVNVTLTSSGSGSNVVEFYLAPFSAEASISGITNNTLVDYGSYGDAVTKTVQYQINANTTPTYASSIEFDVTEILKNNIYNNFFTVAITAWKLISASATMANGPSLSIVYEDIVPTADTLLYPLDVYLNQGDEITFRWRFNCESATKQASYTLKYKKRTDDTYTTIGTGTTELNHKVAAGTFPLGLIDWSIDSADDQGQSAPTAYGSFTVVGKPSAPVITETKNDAKTKISWNASDQVAREVQIMKDGVIIASDYSSVPDAYFIPNMFLDNGTYMIRIRILNSYNYWSDWTSKTFSISAPAPDTPGIQLEAVKNGVKINVVSNTDLNYIYRIVDNEETLIAICNAGSYYIDKAAPFGILVKYYVRSYNTGIADSTKKNIKLQCREIVLNCDGSEIEIYESEESYMPFIETINDDSVLINYDGCKYPTLESGEHINRTITRTFAIDNYSYNVLKKIKLSKKIVLYRDKYSNKMYCKMSEVTASRILLNEAFSVTITFTQCNNNEGVDVNV